jgi:hypothetical protein
MLGLLLKSKASLKERIKMFERGKVLNTEGEASSLSVYRGLVCDPAVCLIVWSTGCVVPLP